MGFFRVVEFVLPYFYEEAKAMTLLTAPHLTSSFSSYLSAVKVDFFWMQWLLRELECDRIRDEIDYAENSGLNTSVDSDSS